VWRIISRYIPAWEKRLSPFQRDALAVLEEYAPLERQPHGNLSGWALPKAVLEALGRPPTPSNRVVLSKALLGLWKRGLVARASGDRAMAGKAFRYVRITNKRNSGCGNAVPAMIQGRSKTKTVRRTVYGVRS
jgi:hypothetical protein